MRGALVQIGARDRPDALGLGRRSSDNPFFCPDARRRSAGTSYLDERAQGRLLGRRASSRSSPTACRRAGASRSTASSTRDLAGGDDEHQRGQGRRDRRRLRRGRAVRRGERRRDAHGHDGAPRSCPTMPAASSAASRPASPSSRGSRSSRPPRSSRRAAPSTAAGNETEIATKGRHDPCVGIRAVPIGEAMMAIVLADHFLRHRGQTGKG